MQTVSQSVGNLFSFLGSSFSANKAEVERIVIKEVNMHAGASRTFTRLAGISGATAVCMAAYGAHGLSGEDEVLQKKKMIYGTANNMHLLHSVALLAVPLCRKPYLVGSLMLSGMAVFCGSCYVNTLMDNPKVRIITPYGGMLLILAWLAMIL